MMGVAVLPQDGHRERQIPSQAVLQPQNYWAARAQKLGGADVAFAWRKLALKTAANLSKNCCCPKNLSCVSKSLPAIFLSWWIIETVKGSESHWCDTAQSSCPWGSLSHWLSSLSSHSVFFLWKDRLLSPPYALCSSHRVKTPQELLSKDLPAFRVGTKGHFPTMEEVQEVVTPWSSAGGTELKKQNVLGKVPADPADRTKHHSLLLFLLLWKPRGVHTCMWVGNVAPFNAFCLDMHKHHKVNLHPRPL